MQKLVWINSKGTEINLTSGDYGITEWEGFSACDVEVQTQNVPFQDGSVFLDALLNNRELSVTLAINDGKDLEKRYRLRRELIAALNPKLGEGYLIYTNDFISKRIKCLAQMPVFPTHNSDKAGTPKASLSWTACDPYWEDVEETSVDFGIDSQPVIDNEGDVTTQMKIDFFTSGVTNPKITNLKTNKFIKYNGSLTEGLQIDTNIGNKSVISEKLNFNKLVNISEVLHSITYSKKLDMFVAVGDSGVILVSYDGKNWLSDVNGDFGYLKSVTYSEDLEMFVAVGDNGKVITSPDGKTWTQQESGIDYGISCVIYAESLFVAVGVYIWTSPDGITWTQRSNSSFNSVIYSDVLNLFVAVENYHIFTSPDGITWTQRSNQHYGLQSVTFSKTLNLFVAVGYTGSDGGYIVTSTNGIDWLVQTLDNIMDLELYAVTYSEDVKLFVCTAYNSNNYNSYILTSIDGINWTKLSNPFPKKNYIMYSEVQGMFIVIGTGIITSYDGENWIELMGAIVGCIFSIAYSDKLHLFVAIEDYHIFTSSDGITWVKEDFSTLSRFITYIKSLNLFVMAGPSLNISSDGVNWEHYLDGKYLNGVCYSNNLKMFVAISNTKIWTSNDGTNWTERYDSSGNLRSITYSEKLNLFVAVGYNGKIITSSDGETWTQQESGVSNKLNSIAYSETLGIFVVTSEDYSTLLNSRDGINWTERSVHKFIYVTFNEKIGIFIGVGNYGVIYTSTDGMNWVEQKSGVFTDLYSLTYCEDLEKFVIVGDGGTVLHSYFSLTENQIKNITPDSDMNFNLDTGRNQLRLNKSDGSFRARITYRQKYIGV